MSVCVCLCLCVVSECVCVCVWVCGCVKLVTWALAVLWLQADDPGQLCNEAGEGGVGGPGGALGRGYLDGLAP